MLIIWTISFVSRVSVIRRSIHIWFIGYDYLYTYVLKKSFGILICSFQWLNNQPVLWITFSYKISQSNFSTLYTPCAGCLLHKHKLCIDCNVYDIFVLVRIDDISYNCLNMARKMWAKWQISTKTLFIWWSSNTWIFPNVIYVNTIVQT